MKLRVLPCLLLCLLLLSGCTAQAEPVEATFFAMDTIMTLRVYGGDQALLDRLQGEVLRLEGLWSVTDGDSEIYAANHALGSPVTVSEDTAALIFQALELGQDTGGALALTFVPWCRPGALPLGSIRFPPKRSWTACSLWWTTAGGAGRHEPDLARRCGAGPGGGGQGIHRPASGAADPGGGGDLCPAGPGGQHSDRGLPPGRRSLAGGGPGPGGRGYAAVLEVEDEAVVTSGGYERYFEQDGVRYWHILDPATRAARPDPVCCPSQW